MTAQAKPRYQQLKELIISRISSGELRPRDRVPSEYDLVNSTGVSRMTANRALRELDTEGYVERVAGVGTFVAELKSASHVLEVRNIADEVLRRGHQHSSTVLKREAQRASHEIRELLHLQKDARVNHVLLIHHENELPIQLEDRYICERFAPELLTVDFTRVTPSAYLSGISPLQEAEHVVRAETPDASVQKQLCMNVNEPCLLVTRRTWAHGRPVSYARLYHPGSRFELTGHYVPPGTQKSNTKQADIVDIVPAGKHRQ